MSWPLVKIRDVAKVVTGKTPSKKDDDNFDGDIPFITPAELNRSVYVDAAPQTLSKKGAASIKLIPKDSVMVCCIGSIGKIAIASQELATNQQINSVIFNTEIVDTKYGFYALQRLKPVMESLAPSTTVAIINKSNFEALEIPLPPLGDQKRIAAILDKADEICRKRQKAINLADDFLRAVFLNMFGDVEANGWDIQTIESIAKNEKGSIRTGPFGSQLLHSEFVDSGISVLGIDNAVDNKFKWGKSRYITEDKYQQLSRYTVHPEDVLITIMGTCGRCAVVPHGIPTAINTKHLCCITLDEKKALPEFLHSFYLFHSMSRSYLARTTKGAIMDGLNMGIIKEMPFPLVPLDLQKKYVSIKRQMYSTISSLSLSTKQGDELFNSLSQKAFSNQL